MCRVRQAASAGAGASSSAGEAPVARTVGLVQKAIRVLESTGLLTRTGGPAAGELVERIVLHAFAYTCPE